MKKHDKFVSTMSFSRGASALTMFAALVLSGCGSSHKTNPAKPDAGGADSGNDVSPGPEAGPEVSVMPTDPQSCAKATNVTNQCIPGMASAIIRGASGGPLIAEITVTGGTCSVSSCASGCTSLSVSGGMLNIGATCDLLVTAVDGRSQLVHMTVIQNPSPSEYICCAYPQVPGSGQWVALDPTAFSPSSVVVDFATDAGPPVVDAGLDGSTPDTANLDTDGAETSGDVPPGKDGASDVYIVPTDEQTCLKSTGVPSCDVWSPSIQVASTNPGLLLSRIVVTAGACTGGTCPSGCSSISVRGTSSLSASSTCDLVVTATDGRNQSIRLTAIANPSPSHMCCGYPQAPQTGIWTALDSVLFSPSSVAVDFDADGGAPIVDGGGPLDGGGLY